MNLKTKLITGFASAAAIALITVSFLGYYYAKNQVVNDINQAMALLLESRIEKMDGWLQGKVKILTTTVGLIQNTVGETNVVQPHLQVYKQDKDLTDLYIGLADGRFITGSGQAPPPGYDPRTRAWYQQAIQAGSLVFSDPYLDNGTKQYVVSGAVPLIQGNQIRGVAGEDILLATLAETIKEINVNGKGYAFVIDRNGVVLAHPDTKLLTTNLYENQEIKDAVKTMFAMDSGQACYKSQGSEKLLIFRKIPTTGWVMAISIDEEDAYAGLAGLRWRFIIVDIMSIIGIAAFAWFFARCITGPIRQLTVNAEQMAQGDLIVKADVSGKDEIAKLGGAFNKMGDGLRLLIQSINLSALKVKTAAQAMQQSADEAGNVSEQIAATISNLAQGSADQAQSMQTGALMVAEVSKAVEAINTNVDLTASRTNHVNTAVANGMEAITTQFILMEDSIRAVANVGRAITLLDGKSKVIGEIVEVISGIAGQTNLLALNAAIEAARAGEQGKGFAVVAEEVRKLAEQSEASSRKITALVREIQSDTKNAVQEMTGAAGLVDGQRDVAAKAKTAFAEIKEAVEAIIMQVHCVTTEVTQLSKRSDDVLVAITDIALIAEKSAAASEEVAAATEQQTSAVLTISQEAEKLLKEAEKLKDDICKFNI